MFSEELLKELKDYTQSRITDELSFYYRRQQKIYASTVFEGTEDLFINLHLMDANAEPDCLHGHDFFELSFVLHGSCEQRIDNDEAITLKEGSLCIMNPYVKHNLSIKTENDIVLNILLRPSLFNATFWSLLEQQEYLSQFFLSFFLSQKTTSEFLVFQNLLTSDIEYELQKICREYLHKNIYNNIMLKCMLISFFTDVIRISSSEIEKQQFQDKTSVQIAALIQYLSVHYATATLKNTAEYFHYNPTYLSAFVKKQTGKNFHKILNDMKATQASYYLLHTSRSIKEISELLGFSQLCNFYDFIQKNFHTTPLRYRLQKEPE